MKLCRCDPPRCEPGTRFRKGVDCVWCWKWEHSEAHRQRHHGDPAAVTPVSYPVPPLGPGILIPQPPRLVLAPTSRRAVVTVVVGREARALFRVSGPHMSAYAKRLGADFLALDWPGDPRWPMSAKYAIPRALDWYDRVAYVDADVLLRPGCVDLFAACAEDEIGLCDELPFHKRQPWFGREAGYHAFREAMGFEAVRPLPFYLNAGVMVVPREYAGLLLPPDRPIPVGHCSEQDHTNSLILDGVRAGTVRLKVLDRACNFQSWTPGFDRAPADAILHWSGAGGCRQSRAAQMRRRAAAG